MIFFLVLFTLLRLQWKNINLDEYDGKEIIENNLNMSSPIIYEDYRTWGGLQDDYGKGIIVDSSNNVYITGYTWSFGGGFIDMVLVKYDRYGVQQWNRTWGGIDGEIGFEVTLDSSEDLYICGASSSSMGLWKYDNSGTLQWNHTWDPDDVNIGYGLTMDSSDNVYLVGYTDKYGAGNADIVLKKCDSSGVQQWNRTWGGNMIDYGYGVAVDSSDNVYIVGGTESYGAGDYDMVLVKYDSSGVQQWNHTWGGSRNDICRAVAVDSSDNIYLAGDSFSDEVGADWIDFVLLKYDSSGVLQWNNTWGGSQSDYCHGLTLDSFGNIYLAGYTDSFNVDFADVLLVEFDPNGIMQDYYLWGGSGPDGGFDIALDSLNNIYIVGQTESYGAGNFDIVLVKFNIERENIGNPGISGISIFNLILLVSIALTIIVIYTRKKMIMVK